MKGKWIHTPWHVVAKKDELELFLMCFPVKYVKNFVILQSNKHLQVPVTMQEFFVFIGCLLSWHATQELMIKMRGGQARQSP